VINICIS